MIGGRWSREESEDWVKWREEEETKEREELKELKALVNTYCAENIIDVYGWLKLLKQNLKAKNKSQ